MLSLTSFKVTNFRNVIDSGWIDLEQMTAIIGTNESGKSNLCEALFRLKPYDEKTSFDLNFDWPVDRWESKDPAASVVRARFTLKGAELETLLDLIRLDAPSETARRPARPKVADEEVGLVLEVARKYDGKLTWQSSGLEGEYNGDELWKWFWARVPKFVYIDDYGALGTRIELDQLARKIKDSGWGALSPAEQTIKIILDLAKIDIDDFLAKGGSADGRTLRTFDKKSASAYLTRQFQALWDQKKVDFDIEIDGPTLNILAKDQGLHMPVPLNQRSTGFRWYVGFAWRFTHATAGAFKDTVLLLEEPGIHLHPSAQADLLRLFERLSETNQIIYTTHLPSLVDPGFPERVRIVELRDHHAKITTGLVTQAKAPMLVIEASLGLSPQMGGLLGSRRTLIVEGPDDATILQKLSRVLGASAKPCLPDDVYVWPALGASKTPMFAGFLIGHKWLGAALLDGDIAGRTAQAKIRDLYKNVEETAFFATTIADALDRKDRPLMIEDVLGVEFYTELVSAAYRMQIDPGDLSDDEAIPLTKRFDALLESRGHGALDKNRVMAVLIKRFSSWKKVGDLPPEVATNAEALFEHLNARLKKLKNEDKSR